jgi:hypothetical protein
MPSRNPFSTDVDPSTTADSRFDSCRRTSTLSLKRSFTGSWSRSSRRISEVLLAAEIPLGRLYQCMPQQELNLLQLTTTVMTQLRACSASREARCAPDPPCHNRSEPHTRPHSGRYPSPNLPRPGDGTEYPSLPDTGRSGPLFRGYTGSLLRYGLPSCSPRCTDLTRNLPQPTGTFTPELPASRSPFSPSGITTWQLSAFTDGTFTHWKVS